MFSTLRSLVLTAATDAVVDGGAGLESVSRFIYDELPDTLPALYCGPTRIVNSTVTRGLSSATGTYDSTQEIAVGLAMVHDSTDVSLAAAEDSLDAVVEALLRRGLDVTDVRMREDDYAGRPVWHAALTVRGTGRLTY